MPSKPALSIVDHDRPAREDTAPSAPSRLAGGSNSAAISIRFGAFCLWPVQRLILQDSQPVHVGSRALEILIALLERPGERLGRGPGLRARGDRDRRAHRQDHRQTNRSNHPSLR